MAMTTGEIMTVYVWPLLTQLVWAIVGITLCIGVWYWLFVLKKRRFWFADIYEQKSDGKLYLVEKDRLYERRLKGGKQTIYTFKKSKVESIPPSFECVQRWRGKEYCDYLRVQGEYIPLTSLEQGIPDFDDKETKKNLFRVIAKHLKKIRGIPTTTFNANNVEKEYVYAPLSRALKYNVDFKPISYDVNMMRINEIDNLDQMFKKKQDFWQKYGAVIIIGMGVVMVIVVAVLSFEYMEAVTGNMLGAADKVAAPLQALVGKISGNVPVT